MEFDWTVKLKWIRATEWIEVRFGTSRAGAVDVPLYRAAGVDAHPEADWDDLRRVKEGQRSPLAALRPKSEATPVRV
ncbi:hypothetical protein [Streptomyces globisporus]|uniref:hypothetical protein n=1 Tax=Streptomyces globisporus TaxID=1908 RepID=UPI000A7AA00C|nr:hypothetical protein [Streptomyces globisporus]